MAFIFNDSLKKGFTKITTIPGDKSISHRAIMFGSLADNESTFKNFLFAEDCINTIKIFQQLGVTIQFDPVKKMVKVNGVGLHGLTPPDKPLDVGNSGTSIRLITGILAAQSFATQITGDETIQVRPMKRIIYPLTNMGASIDAATLPEKADLFPPLSIKPATELKGIKYSLPMASAQVKSAILLAGLYAKGKTTVVEPRRSRNHTEVMLKAYNAPIEFSPSSTTIKQTKTLHNSFDEPLIIPSDFSSAAFFIVLGLLQQNAELSLTKIGVNPTRSPLIDVLKKMGGNIEIKNKKTKLEPYADIEVRFSELTNITVPESVIPFIIDEIPILAVAGMFAKGTMTVSGAKELRFKESDRIKKIVHLVKEFGGKITEKADGFILQGGIEKQYPNIKSGKDHRIVMSAVIASLLADRPVVIDDINCVRTSFPNFFDIIKSLVEESED